MKSWKETPPSECEVKSVVYFLIPENNSEAKIHRCLCAAYREENIMKLKPATDNLQNVCEMRKTCKMRETCEKKGSIEDNKKINYTSFVI